MSFTRDGVSMPDPNNEIQPPPIDAGLLDRREAIRRVSALLGGVVLVGGSALWTGCRAERVPGSGTTFSEADIAYLDEIAETILPETTTPGAKAAKVGAFMALMVTDTYEDKDQRIFRDGMRLLDEASSTSNGTPFMDATAAQRLTLLQRLDGEQKAYQDAKKDDDPTHYFRMMKELALLGFFTSEVGMTKAMRYVESPGRFDPCVPHEAGETSWADHA
jgi:hypothetical protein